MHQAHRADTDVDLDEDGVEIGELVGYDGRDHEEQYTEHDDSPPGGTGREAGGSHGASTMAVSLYTFDVFQSRLTPYFQASATLAVQ